MSNYLKELLRPYTPEEQKVIDRLIWRKTVINVLFLAAVLVVAGLVLGTVLFSKTITYAPYQGTWIAAEGLADGFQAEDRYLECKSNEFMRSGEPYGTMKTRDGKQYMYVSAPAGSYRCDLTVDGDTLTVEYTLPAVAYTVRSGYAYNDALAIKTEAKHQVDTYIRISTKCDLTPEERDALY